MKFLEYGLLPADVQQFVVDHPHNNIFQSVDLFHVYTQVKNVDPFFFAVLDSNNEILGTISGSIQRNYFWPVRMMTSRAIIQGGPIIREDDPFVLDFLLKGLVKALKNKTIYIQFRNLWKWENLGDVFVSNGFNYQAHLDIIHDLSKPIKEQFCQMDKSRRKNIRKAEKLGIQVRELKNTNEFDGIYKLIKSTYEKVNLPCPDKGLFMAAYKGLSPSSNIVFLIAEYIGEIIGVRIALCYNHLIYDWYAGSSALHLDRYPNEYLSWKVMEWGSLRGYKTFDFGGAGKPGIPYGVRDFKLRFGGKMVENGRFERINSKQLYGFGKKGLRFKKIVSTYLK